MLPRFFIDADNIMIWRLLIGTSKCFKLSKFEMGIRYIFHIFFYLVSSLFFCCLLQATLGVLPLKLIGVCSLFLYCILIFYYRPFLSFDLLPSTPNLYSCTICWSLDGGVLIFLNHYRDFLSRIVF